MAQKIGQLLTNPANVRSICIIAHVDHGKTTLADALLACNGIISVRQSGKLRYLDNRPDEQQRGITMKSSAVSLIHTCDANSFVVNLIDSPGHVDFSSEVSTAVRMSDGALLVVDVIEGVSAQTQAVLRQAWQEKLTLCLVLNKIDRLITELQLSPSEALEHLRKILEQVNAIQGSFFAAQRMQAAETSDEHYDVDDSHLYFDPAIGNVIFASAYDGWGFTVSQFATIVSGRLGIAAKDLTPRLWGDYYLSKDENGCTVKEGARDRGKSPIFATVVLQTIWDIYNAACIKRDQAKLTKIMTTLQIKVSARDSQQSDPKLFLHALFSQWLPVGPVCLDTICRIVPPPNKISAERVRNLMFGTQDPTTYPPKCLELEKAVQICDPASSDVIAYVTKMVAVDAACLVQTDTQSEQTEARAREELIARLRAQAAATAAAASASEGASEHGGGGSSGSGGASNSGASRGASGLTWVALVRVFSGTLRPGHQLLVLGPRHDPRRSNNNNVSGACVPATIGQVYLSMGREFVSIPEGPSGAIVGVTGFEDLIPKTATLSSSEMCVPFAGLYLQAPPIVRVALETDIGSLSALKKGLQKLVQADPCVEVYLQDSGELVLVAAGEVHIDRCLTDLRERFCPGITITVSPPIIPFRETIVPPPKVDMLGEKAAEYKLNTSHYLLRDVVVEEHRGVVRVSTPRGRWTLHIRATPLPPAVTQFMEEHADFLRDVYSASHEDDTPTSGESEPTGNVDESTPTSVGVRRENSKLIAFRTKLQEKMTAAGLDYANLERILSVGPRHSGACLLINRMSDVQLPVWLPDTTSTTTPASSTSQSESTKSAATVAEISSYYNSLEVGFQLATQSGPMCEEPVTGVAFEIVDVTIAGEDAPEIGLSGQIISAMREACRLAMLVQPMRLVTAMYRCALVVPSASLGKVYAVLNRRNSQILSEDMKEGADSFMVTALIPATESFGFAEELRKKTSGLAMPQLVFSHWAVLPMDPFWTPSTTDELEHYGDKADAPNHARVLLDSARKRRGLYVEEKIVEHAEKQRTLSKNK